MFIQIQNVKKLYKRRKQPALEALKGLSLEIQEGEILGLLGVNGAGKTTLSSIIASLIPPSFGDVLWKGKSIYKQLSSYRRIIGFCPQKPNLDPLLTIEQSLTYSGRFYGMQETEIKKQKAYLIERLGLEAYANAKAEVLSGGYKQRFLIARSLMHQPKLVILDEPTVGLDPHIRHELWSVIRELKNEGVSIILTTHYLEEAQALTDRVSMIHMGNIEVTDTPENVMRTYNKEKLEDVLLAIQKEST